ncbi:DUF4156 domain-containing protein [Paraglaciecola arctica]|uniref:Lipoprotein n=1 Tax=Paraglaciecola arctica BSs20135 TaxID=493475 RepID=K6XAG5_9ALTE|nr:DUF4156 domain-containing protein [Paraglaciecola arctica]GAC17624.1 hypothetical protein GARC_0643 [Paraglaciecola arctica BSs20135]
MRVLIILVTMFLVFGCTTTLTVKGQSVRIVESNQQSNCKFLGTASAFDTLGATAGHESENALNELRNKAAILGGNAIKILNLDSTIQGATATGEVLICNFGEGI